MENSKETTDQMKFHPSPHDVTKSHKFWSQQPVPPMQTLIKKDQQIQQGPIDPPKTVQQIRQQPLRLPKGLQWVSIDINDDQWIQQIYRLLTQNYVQDQDNYFRFDYSISFLRWALMPPGYRTDWHLGVNVIGRKRLVGFISAIPAQINCFGSSLPMVQINFLCVYKQYRQKRLAPVLIREITRRVNLTNVWQAIYTAGIVLPTPVAQARYYHRSLDPIKLVQVGFTRLSKNLTRARAQKLYKLQSQPQIPGVRQMVTSDVPVVFELLSAYLSKFSLYVEFSIEEVEYFLLGREGVIYSYVVENSAGQVTDFFSFYSLPSSVLKGSKHTHLYAAYAYYVVPGQWGLIDLFKDMLILAKGMGFDVFNALDIMDNIGVFKELKFGIGDGSLQFYLYNWRTHSMVPAQVGIVLV